MKIIEEVFIEGAFKTTVHGYSLGSGVMTIGPDFRCIAGENEQGEIVHEVIPIKEKAVLLNMPILRGFYNFFITLYWLIEAQFVLKKLNSMSQKGQTDFKAKKQSSKRINTVSIKTFWSLMLFTVITLFYMATANAITKGVISVMQVYDISSKQIIAFKMLNNTMYYGLFILLMFLSMQGKRWGGFTASTHMAIHCLENELSMIIQSQVARKYSPLHQRSGSLYIVMTLWSLIMVSSLWLSPMTTTNLITRFFLVFLVIGFGYELRVLFGKDDHKLSRWISEVGLYIQLLLVSGATDRQIEIALTSMNHVVPMEDGKDSWAVL